MANSETFRRAHFECLQFGYKEICGIHLLFCVDSFWKEDPCSMFLFIFLLTSMF